MSKESNRNLTLKIFAVIIAIILRGYVMSEENPPWTDTIRNIDVNFARVESLEKQGLVIMEPRSVKVSVEVAGKRNSLKDISSKDIMATVDLSGYREGENKVPILVEVPQDVELVNYSPKEVLFKFEQVINKKHLISLETEGQLADGYILGEAEIKPQSIYIEGPRSWVNSVERVVASINVSDKIDDIEGLVPIRLLDDKDEDVRGLDQEQSFVDVFIPVYQIKSVPIELQTEGELADNLEIVDINIEPATIDIKGKKEILATINSINTTSIDINSLVGKRNVLVDLELPDNVELVDPNQQVTVTLNIAETISKTLSYSLEDVNIKNLDARLKIDEVDLGQKFDLIVVGISEVIDSIEKEDLSVEIDLKDLEEGGHTVDLLVGEKTGIFSIDLVPSSLNINLIKE